MEIAAFVVASSLRVRRPLLTLEAVRRLGIFYAGPSDLRDRAGGPPFAAVESFLLGFEKRVPQGAIH